MNKTKDYIIDRKKISINKALQEILLTDINWSDVKNILEDCILMEYKSKNVVDICNKAIETYKPIADIKHKDRNANEKNIFSCKSIAIKLLELVPYRFAFMGGAMMDVKTIYATSHTDAWSKASAYTINVRGGIVRSILCLEVDGKDTGTFHNLNAMFTPKKLDSTNSVKADDLLPDWKEYK